MNYHFPVLLNETISCLSVVEEGVYIDATLGHGGHTIEILKQKATVYGFDQDSKNLEIATQRINSANLNETFFPINQNFINIKSFLKKQKINKIDGLIADLGLSQNQQTGQDRGFSFNDQSSLDMRLNPLKQTLTAEEIINTYSFDDLYQIFTKIGQELYSKPIIFQIIKERQKAPIKTGQRLAEIIREYFKNKHLRSKNDPSTKIFLSLRITVNQEYANLLKLLNHSLDVVKPGGNVCLITFHSGEDRIVKQFIQKNSSKIISQKLIKPTFTEIKKNPLSRSAILRTYKII